MLFEAALFFYSSEPIGFLLHFVHDSTKRFYSGEPVVSHISLNCVIVLVLNHFSCASWLVEKAKRYVYLPCYLFFFRFFSALSAFPAFLSSFPCLLDFHHYLLAPRPCFQ